MKLTFTILLLIFCMHLNAATNYYFSNAGNDAASGTSAGTAWRTAGKFTTLLSSTNAGDSILFNRGDTFIGFTMTSGASGINLAAYGTGAKPVLTGLTSITSWTETSTGSHVWDATCNSGLNLDLVIINGVTTPPGRTPNAGSYFNIDSYTGISGNYGTITSTGTPIGSADWTTAQAVIRVNEYDLDLDIITGHSGNTLTYYSPDNPKSIEAAGQKFFIQKHNSTLDVQNEWVYNPTYHVLRMWSIADPATLNVQAATVDNFYNVAFRNHVTFSNIKFSGYDSCVINSYYPASFVANNCDFEDVGVDGIHLQNDSAFLITNCTFNRIGNTGIFAHFSTYININHNNVDSCGMLYGFGLSNNQMRDGIAVDINTVANTGDSTYICDNTVTNVGYCGISWNGYKSQVLRNTVNGFGNICADGGGIYTYGYFGLANRRVVKNNTVLNGYGNHDMYSITGNSNMPGIYMDDNSGQVDIDSNTVSNGTRAGIFLHNTVDIKVRDNTVYETVDAAGIVLEDDDLGNAIRSMVVSGNIINVPATRSGIQLRSDANDYGSMGIFTGNYYSRSTGGNIFNTIGNVTASYTMAGWNSAFGYDIQSVFTQTPVDSIRFEYNAGAVNQYIFLPTTHSNLKGDGYYRYIQIPPYRSLLLYKKTFDALKSPRPIKLVPQ